MFVTAYDLIVNLINHQQCNLTNCSPDCRSHDIDNNTKLDGLELLHAIQHTFHEVADNEELTMQDLPWIVGESRVKLDMITDVVHTVL